MADHVETKGTRTVRLIHEDNKTILRITTYSPKRGKANWTDYILSEEGDETGGRLFRLEKLHASAGDPVEVYHVRIDNLGRGGHSCSCPGGGWRSGKPELCKNVAAVVGPVKTKVV